MGQLGFITILSLSVSSWSLEEVESFNSCSFGIKCQLKYFAMSSLACGWISILSLLSIGLAALVFK